MLLVDSDILIDHLKGKPAATRFVATRSGHGERLATTTLNAAEIWRGAVRARAPGMQQAVRDLLGGMALLPFGPRAAERFGALMADLDGDGTPIPAVDGMMAAIALDAEVPLVTRNVRHFDRIGGLVVRAPDS